MDENTVYSEKEVITTADEHDRNQLEVLVDDKDALYVFDRGYIDYERFDCMTDEGYFFVSRVRKNAALHERKPFDVTKESIVLSDEMAYLGSYQNRTENVFCFLKVKDTKGNELILITNRFDLKPDKISEMYRQRWEIEQFLNGLNNVSKLNIFTEQAKQ